MHLICGLDIWVLTLLDYIRLFFGGLDVWHFVSDKQLFVGCVSGSPIRMG